MLRGSLKIFSRAGDFRASEHVPVVEGADTWQRCLILPSFPKCVLQSELAGLFNMPVLKRALKGALYLDRLFRPSEGWPSYIGQT